MTLSEMMDALSDVTVEFPKFSIDGKRAALWYKKFSKMPVDAFRRVVGRVLETCAYAPQLHHFEEARNTLAARNKSHTDHERCSPENVRKYEQWLTTEKGLVRESVGERGYRFTPRRRMDIIVQALGHKWVNDQLAIDSPRACLDFVKGFGIGGDQTGESLAHNKRYKEWTAKAFVKAWVKLYGREPSEEEQKAYE